MAKVLRFRTAYDGRRRLSKDCSEGDRTHQEFKEECDINTIMQRFSDTGLLTHVARFQGKYGDFGSGQEFHDHMNVATSAQEMFMTLPAELRDLFDNDVGAFLTWTESATEEEMREVGLLPAQRPAEEPPPPAEDPSPAEEPPAE